MYIDASENKSFFLSTNDGTKINEGEKYYPSTDELIMGIVEKNHPELSEWIKTLLNKEILEIFQNVDTNGNGQIDIDEIFDTGNH